MRERLSDMPNYKNLFTSRTTVTLNGRLTPPAQFLVSVLRIPYCDVKEALTDLSQAEDDFPQPFIPTRGERIVKKHSKKYKQRKRYTGLKVA